MVFLKSKYLCEVLLLLLIPIFFSCSSEKNRSEINYGNMEEEEFGYELKEISNTLGISRGLENSEEYLLSVYELENPDEKLEAILVFEEIDNNYTKTYHYTTEGDLLATILIRDNNYIEDIQLEYEDTMVSRGVSSWYRCTNNQYKVLKERMNENHALACGLGDIYFGACTVATALYGGFKCL